MNTGVSKLGNELNAHIENTFDTNLGDWSRCSENRQKENYKQLNSGCNVSY